MQVVGLTLKTVEARRFQERPAGQVQLRVDHNSHFERVTVAEDRLEVSFQFTTSYGGFGVIKTEGDVVLRSEDAPAALAQWNETRALPQEVAQMLHSTILGACIPEAVTLAKTVRLPPPIPLPQVRMGSGQDAKADGPAGPPPDAPEIG